MGAARDLRGRGAVRMGLTVYDGRPLDEGGRSEKEIAVYELLDRLGISYKRVDHEPVYKMDDCHEIHAALAPVTVCKNLFLRDTKNGKLYLLMLRGDKKLHSKEIARQIGSAHLEFASPELMKQYLHLEPGAVSVMGLIYDTDNRVNLLVDEDLLSAESISCHPCVNTASLRLKTHDLFGRFLEAVHHGYTPVHVMPTGQREASVD